MKTFFWRYSPVLTIGITFIVWLTYSLFDKWTINEWGSLASVFTSIIATVWFGYTYYRSLKLRFHEQFIGKYPMRSENTIDATKGKSVETILLVNFFNIDDYGNFDAEIDYSRNTIESETDKESPKLMSGLFFIKGKIHYELGIDKRRNPTIPIENQRYEGNFWLLAQDGNDFTSRSIAEHKVTEYRLLFYRQMGIIEAEAKNTEVVTLIPEHLKLEKQTTGIFNSYSVRSNIVKSWHGK